MTDSEMQSDRGEPVTTAGIVQSEHIADSGQSGVPSVIQNGPSETISDQVSQLVQDWESENSQVDTSLSKKESSPKITKAERISQYEKRKEELARDFDRNGYKYVRGELFANNYDSNMTIRDGNITFNNASIRSLPDVVYINILINE